MKTTTQARHRIKAAAALLTALVAFLSSRAQNAPVTPSFPQVIDLVLRDFPNNLTHITGELMLAQGETENYASTVALPESEGCVITHYHSTEDTSVSWQAKMLLTDDFGKADHVYQELYRKLQQCYIQLMDGTIVYLKGTWSPAKEEAPFTSSTLRLTIDDQRYKGVRVELELVYELAQWGVSINIYSRGTDDKGETVVREP
jgi:hypothetical protein